MRNRTHAQLTAQRETASLSADQLSLQLAELEEDIEAAIIKSPVQGQIFELADANALYMREGDKIARIRTDNGFEVEADIPADYIGFCLKAMLFMPGWKSLTVRPLARQNR